MIASWEWLIILRVLDLNHPSNHWNSKRYSSGLFCNWTAGLEGIKPKLVLSSNRHGLSTVFLNCSPKISKSKINSLQSSQIFSSGLTTHDPPTGLNTCNRCFSLVSGESTTSRQCLGVGKPTHADDIRHWELHGMICLFSEVLLVMDRWYPALGY